MPVKATRFDTGELRKAERTAAGYLRAPAIATRTGVLTYRREDGSTVRELRHPDDVFDPASMATLAGVPVTDLHPNVTDPEVKLLDADNTGEFMAGFTGELVARDGNFLTVPVTITDSGLIEDVLLGRKSEVSCGYICEHDATPGTFDGQAYDIRQKNIVYNHLAVLPRGRAGPDVRIKLDAACAVQVDEVMKPLEESRMEKITLNGVDYQCAPELKAAIEKAIADAGAANTDDSASEVGDPNAVKPAAKADAPPPAATPADKEKDAMQAKLDAATEENRKLRLQVAAKTDGADPVKVRELVKVRAGLESVARRTLTKDEVAKLDAMDDKAIKMAVIKAEHKAVNLDGKSDAYIDARYDAVVDTLGADRTGAGLAIAGGREQSRNDAAEGGADAARERARAKTLERSHRPAGTAAK